MSTAQSIARIYDRYSEEELRNAKDEPDTDVQERFTGRAAVAFLFTDDPHGTHATRRRVRRAFEGAGHGMPASQALANARRIFRQDAPR